MSLGFLLWDVSNKWQKLLLKELNKIEITHVQYLLLYNIYEMDSKGEQITQSKIAQLAGTDIMMTSKVTRTLQNKGLISRERSKADARSFEIHVTKEGKKKLKKAIKTVEKFDSKFFNILKEKSIDLEKRLKKLKKKN